MGPVRIEIDPLSSFAQYFQINSAAVVTLNEVMFDEFISTESFCLSDGIEL